MSGSPWSRGKPELLRWTDSVARLQYEVLGLALAADDAERRQHHQALVDLRAKLGIVTRQLEEAKATALQAECAHFGPPAPPGSGRRARR